MLHIRRGWRLLICLWSLAAICLFYAIFERLDSHHIFPLVSRNKTEEMMIQNNTSRKQSCLNLPWICRFEIASATTDISYTLLSNRSSGHPLRYRQKTLFLTLKNFHEGRFGNQMFKYASLLGIGRTLNRDVFISPGSSLDVAFQLGHLAEISDSERTRGEQVCYGANLASLVARESYLGSSLNFDLAYPYILSHRWPRVKEIFYAKFDVTLLDKLQSENLRHRNMSLSGFLQSWKYFKDINKEIRTEFTFRSSVSKQRDEIIYNLLQDRRQDFVLVGVHVRRSDLLLNRSIAVGYTVPNESYFLKAFEWMKNKFEGEKVIFLIASDDFLWCERHLKGRDVMLMPPASHKVHLSLLGSCDHVIMSSGTFGWWGAWLAGGYTIYYKNYPAKGSKLSNRFSAEDYFPPDWIGMDD